MKKLDNFTKCLNILANADFKLAWKALHEIMRMHGVEGVSTVIGCKIDA